MAQELSDYQRATVDFGLEHGRFGMALPRGGRKTATSLVWAREARAKRTLIVAPTQVQYHWAEEATRWFPELGVWQGRGTRTYRGQQRAAVAKDPGPVALVLGYETMRDDIDELLKVGFDTVIADEAHRLKSRDALWHKAFKKLATRVQRMDLATGNMITNRAEELWSILHMIDPKGYRSFWRWAHEHFNTEVMEYGYNPRPVERIVGPKDGHLELIRAEAAKHIIEFDVDVLGLGEPIYTVLPVELSAEERRFYDQLVGKGWAMVGGETIKVSNKISGITRARQIASDWGSISLGFGNGSKVKATLELIKDLDEPVVVFSAFRETADRIFNEMGSRASLYHGGLAQTDRDLAKKDFINGETTVFSATLRAAGEGLDGLQHVCSKVIMVDRDFSPVAEDQAIGRVHRSGQTKPVTVWHVVARNTEDQRVAEAHVQKRDVMEALSLA